MRMKLKLGCWKSFSWPRRRTTRYSTYIHTVSVVHPDPAGSEIICKDGSGSVINSGSGFESGSKLSSAYN
jgi:hypothetical protein